MRKGRRVGQSDAAMCVVAVALWVEAGCVNLLLVRTRGEEYL